MLTVPPPFTPRIYIALPVQDESCNLDAFYACLQQQSYTDFSLVVCVNQPDDWWGHPEENAVCADNQRSLELLNDWKGFPVQVLDKSSRGKGWTGKHFGVGWARKTALDRCREMAGDEDILLCLDADTSFGPGYFKAIVEAMGQHPQCVALSVPYYHHPAGSIEQQRAIFRYEIYMRYYAINLWRIGSPYAFTALGSAIAVRAAAYTRVGGITPFKSGEDFYFLQKLRKFGPLLTWCREKVYPSSRLSTRVFFGTGPALIKGLSGDWSSYPLYATSLFDEVRQTTELFPALLEKDIPTPMDAFLRHIFNETDIWQPLRFKKTQFVRACHEKVDALRILQFLKSKALTDEHSNAGNLTGMLKEYYKDYIEDQHPEWMDGFTFSDADLTVLASARDLLVKIEEDYQKEYYLKTAVI